MDQNGFDTDACRAVLQEKIAPIYGWPAGTHQREDRLVFYLQLVHGTGALSPGHHLVDLGAGLSPFGPLARALGLEVTVVDDFGGGGGVERESMAATRRLIKAWKDNLGVQVVEQDFIAQPLPLDSNSVDVVSCFHSLEHWHHSPKRLFNEITRVLKPRGHLILATPNAANLRKRFYVPAGRNIFAGLSEWYQDGDPVFRGHVREPTVADLHQILAWNGLEVVATYGRNFIGRDSHALAFLPPNVVSAVAAGSECILRFFPTLCSDIHVIGQKHS